MLNSKKLFLKDAILFIAGFRRLFQALCCTLFIAIGLSSCSNAGEADPSQASDITIYAAASTRVLENDLQNFAAALDSPVALILNFDGSAALVQQLNAGAPADIFISADKRTMDKAVAQNLVKSPQLIATNSMVMVVPKGNPAHITGVDSSLDKAILVLCDAQVPCGAVSQNLAAELGLRLKPASLENKVSDVLGKVVSGEADAGWVYRTDAAAAGDAVEVIEIPAAEKHINQLWAGITTNSANPAGAAAIIKLLVSPEFATSWEKYGFKPVAP
ncbi:molybdate ABC transporter substrate-binding protein [Corynebacterium caspium]|uniref:molybdate ABC transporter substrate-binding protein n=1 Tax=Corynebacterium caspium TaxID=234828 RepID=UPI00035C219B|nr:molybdate ABC transporter substrate-binding protein [Corynebacterium caspium]WKD59475.1 Molybdate-binding periplasmic protein precursor [Corynebacterium caspium DSM 44850]